MSNAIAWGEAAFLGLIQGLTEFLPISSSAHLRIIGPLLPSGTDPGAAFTAITQIGTEAAVLLYFRHDIARIIRAWCLSFTKRGSRSDPDARMGWLIAIGTLPIAILGLLFKDAIEGSLRNLYITATMLIVFALILALADRYGAKKQPLSKLTWGHGILFGFAQAMALIPGVSRSGGTITAGLLMGYTREAAARYSFLLAIPAVMASGFYQLYRSWEHGSAVAPGPTALATLVSFGVGYFVIVWFLRLVSTRGYMPFVWYRIALGTLVFALLGLGVLSAT
ncbi:MAG: undecaprenyl-diphosphate phosphatase [Hydrogenophaga sp.]|uniref:undecaprenyl-diphosphate phosphatase n=1 Tax=Hydrogenophaga sp. TaxID=1904254 RepID=UPI002719C47F|nr:undecaprenyl-diphosphate phosphatase [Hydrogenophaga sp.]MDO9148437.1 undecaprenyl-diphosphate phosphatase [Hydrogenophaga sp.]MDO9605166.1 undecaprenyl-diphosphate phosphatase [Hydrogenophaga sp.]MDP2165446.1 undecaprenyl-diphosphate phosphatase [Hydrogenophaga sp.]MDP3475438.1 undecaprenyl-diphosphate phosphatase [Hydrogenophaga sp.]